MDKNYINEFAIAHGYKSGEELEAILDEQQYAFDLEEFIEYVENGDVVDKGPRKLRSYWAEEYDEEGRMAERERTDLERLEIADINIRDINTVLGLHPDIMTAWDDGIVTISYLDDDLNAHVIRMEDDSEFMEYKKKLEDEWDVTVYHGIKWDAAESPVFFAMSDDCRFLNRREGLLIGTAYRYQKMQIYYWVDGKSYDDQVMVDIHDGVLYLTQAFPGLQAKENDMDKSLFYRRKEHREKSGKANRSHSVDNLDRIIKKNQEHMRMREERNK